MRTLDSVALPWTAVLGLWVSGTHHLFLTREEQMALMCNSYPILMAHLSPCSLGSLPTTSLFFRHCPRPSSGSTELALPSKQG